MVSKTYWQLKKDFTLWTSEHIPTLPDLIDCVTLSNKVSRKVRFCLKNNISIGFYLDDNFYDYKYRFLITTEGNEKRIKFNELYDMTYEDTYFFDGKLDGIAVTAALSYNESDKDFILFFAGRRLCKQEISRTNWLKMCDIVDIADWIDCTDEILDEDIKLLYIILGVLVTVVVVIIIAIIIGLCLIQATGMTKISRGGICQNLAARGGGYFGFSAQGGYIPPSEKTGSSAFSVIKALIKVN